MVSDREREVLGFRLAGRHVPAQLADAVKAQLYRFLGFHDFNAFYRELPACDPVGFARVFMQALGVDLVLSGEPLSSIPSTGPLLVVANHPFGILEGVALDSVIVSVRPDSAVMVVHMLSAIPEFRARHVFVGPRGKRSKRKISVRGWRQAYGWLARGGALTVFPAGHIARFNWRDLAVADRTWSAHVATIARRTNAPILPVYFHGRNGWPFQLAALIFPALQDVLAVREVMNKRGWTLRASIGRLIPPSELSRFSTDEEAISYLRRATEKLARNDRPWLAPTGSDQ